MKKCFITVAIGDRFKELAKLTSPLMLDYCMQHNYDFVQLHTNHGHFSPAWARHEYEKLLHSYDIVFYSDTDTVFMPNIPDIISLPELKTLDFDVAGSKEVISDWHKRGFESYAKRAGLKPLNIKKLSQIYICSGCVILTKGFLKYYDEPRFPEVDAEVFRDQNALNYAIQIGRVTVKAFPKGVAGCPYLYCKPDEIKYIRHFNLSMNPNHPEHYAEMIQFIKGLKK